MKTEDIEMKRHLMALLLSVAFGALTTTFAPCSPVDEEDSENCDGHKETLRTHVVNQGQGISVMVKADGTILDEDLDVVNDLGVICWKSEKIIQFKVVASDGDYNVCKSGGAANYIENTDLSVKITTEDGDALDTIDLIVIDSEPDLVTRTWTNCWEVSEDAAGHTVNFDFQGTVKDIKCSYHGDSHDTNVNMQVYSAKLDVLQVGLEEANAGNEPDISPKICINAQDEYKKAKWTAVVKPSGNATVIVKSGDVEISSNSDGTYGTSLSNVSDGDAVWVKMKSGAARGYYVLQIEHDESLGCNYESAGIVFRFEFHVDEDPVTTNPETAPDMDEIYTDYLADYGVGTPAEFKYKKQARVKANPAFSWNFRVTTEFDHSVYSIQTTYYEGCSELPSFWLQVRNSTEWRALKTLCSVVGGQAINKVVDVIDFALSLADDDEEYNALGTGKETFDVDGTPYGRAGHEHATTSVPVLLGLLDDWCFPATTSAWPGSSPVQPTWGPPRIKEDPHLAGDGGASAVSVMEIFEYRISRDINTGFAFQYGTKATYGWQYEGYSYGGFCHCWHAGGINVVTPKMKMQDWRITPSHSYEIVSLIP